MLVTDVALEFLSTRRIRASWTGTDGYVSWIFINGKQSGAPRHLIGTAKTVDLTVPDPFCLEIHEVALTEFPTPIVEPLERRPTIWWNPREDALRYTVYRKASEAAVESCFASQAHVNGRAYYEAPAPQDLRGVGGAWNWFRVEAKSLRGVESVRASWPFFVEGLPAPAVSCEVTGGSGVFTLALGT